MKKLGFGMMRLPLCDPNDNSSIDFETTCKMVDRFLEKGFTYFDTAYMYHDGQSERIAKRALVMRHDRSSFTLASKMPVMRVTCPEDAPRFFEEQLEKCGVGFFDYYLVHCLNTHNYQVGLDNGVFDYLRSERAKGRIRHLGFSFHDTAEVLDRILTEQPYMEFVQIQLNYLDWDDHKVQSRLCYETARKHGKEIVVMEPVKGGTLARLPEEAEKMLKDYAPDASPASYAIRFAAGKEGILTVLSGMSNLEQLEDNTSYMRDFVPLDATEEELVRKTVSLIRQSAQIDCTGCSYCTEDCPAGIPTPAFFKLYNEHLKRLDKGEFYGKDEYEALAAKTAKASSCMECGLCESRCPQKIPVMRALRRVRRTFE